MRKLKASELVFDGGVYPRGRVDPQNIGYIAQAIQAGAAMPPVVVCKKSKRIVDGIHRVRANQKLYGMDAEIECVEKTYRNDQELFKDAMRYNSVHGQNLTTFDRSHCVQLAESLGIDDAAVAECLNVSPDWIGKLRTDRSAVSGKLHVPIKRTIAHKAGQTLTKEQVGANEKLSGMNQVFYVNQIITLIESDLLNLADDNLMERLKKLHELLSGLLVSA